MMDITRTARPEMDPAGTNLWLCKGCGVVHLSIDGRLFDLSRSEFGRLSEAVMEINYESLMPSILETNKIAMSGMIH